MHTLIFQLFTLGDLLSGVASGLSSPNYPLVLKGGGGSSSSSWVMGIDELVLFGLGMAVQSSPLLLITGKLFVIFWHSSSCNCCFVCVHVCMSCGALAR